MEENMKLLKLKALIYRWTGLYLAQKEEKKYLESKGMNYYEKNKCLGISMESYKWRDDNGFYLPIFTELETNKLIITLLTFRYGTIYVRLKLLPLRIYFIFLTIYYNIKWSFNETTKG